MPPILLPIGRLAVYVAKTHAAKRRFAQTRFCRFVTYRLIFIELCTYLDIIWEFLLIILEKSAYFWRTWRTRKAFKVPHCGLKHQKIVVADESGWKLVYLYMKGQVNKTKVGSSLYVTNYKYAQGKIRITSRFMHAATRAAPPFARVYKIRMPGKESFEVCLLPPWSALPLALHLPSGTDTLLPPLLLGIGGGPFMWFTGLPACCADRILSPGLYMLYISVWQTTCAWIMASTSGDSSSMESDDSVPLSQPGSLGYLPRCSAHRATPAPPRWRIGEWPLVKG